MDTLALILSIIGCVNWGLVGIFQFDLVAWLFGGSGSLFSRIIYTIVGLAGLWAFPSCSARRRLWMGNELWAAPERNCPIFTFSCGTARCT